MDRQKQRGSTFNGARNNSGLSIDGVSRPIQPLHTLPHYNPRPEPEPIEGALAATGSTPAAIPAPTMPPQEVDALKPQQGQQPSLLGASLPPQAFSSTPTNSSKPKTKFRRALKPALISLAVLMVGFGAWFGSSIIGNIDKVFHGNVFSDAHALISGANLKESGGRINILLGGDSADDPGHQGADLADSIMVISYDPTTKSGFLLSIPRDLWVHVPTLGNQKINAANDVTTFHAAGLPSGGMGQLQQIVQTDLGIPIDYEALINYAAFKDAVDTVGGVSITINSPDPRGIYDSFTHLKLPNGKVNLSGQEALDLARARGDDVSGDISYGLPNGDFTRTQYQREMLEALFKKALSAGVLSNPLKISSLFSSFSSNIQTDLSLGDVISLMRLTGGLNLSRLQSVSYSYGGAGSLLTNYLAPDGEEALIPSAGVFNYSQLRAYYKQLTSSNPITQEGATVTLLNGSNVVGLAAREEKVLQSQGFNVVSIDDASNNYPTSMIVDNVSGQMTSATSQLEKDIKGQVVTSTSGSAEAGEATNYSSSFVVVLGQDWDSTGNNGSPVQN